MIEKMQFEPLFVSLNSRNINFNVNAGKFGTSGFAKELPSGKKSLRTEKHWKFRNRPWINSIILQKICRVAF